MLIDRVDADELRLCVNEVPGRVLGQVGVGRITVMSCAPVLVPSGAQQHCGALDAVAEQLRWDDGSRAGVDDDCWQQCASLQGEG